MALTLRRLDGDSHEGFGIFRDDELVHDFESRPTLFELRELERTHGVRLNLLDAGLECHQCDDEIGERFSADGDGLLLCWSCSTADMNGRDGETPRPADPTKAVLSQSNLNVKSLCDYVINVATGCRHGCRFCYVPSTPNIKMRTDMLEQQANVEEPQREWGTYLLYRDDLPERLHDKLERKRSWNSTPRGRGVVMISSGTDPYQDRRSAQITRGCVQELVNHEVPVRILTRSPTACRDRDLFEEAGEYVTVGFSIPSLDEREVQAMEPGAPPPTARMKALRELSDAGVRVYLSMSPTYPTQDKEDLRHILEEVAEVDPDVVFHEPINPRGANMDMMVKAAKDAGLEDLAQSLDEIRHVDTWVDYSVHHLRWAEELDEEMGLDIHIWPDKALVQNTPDPIATYLKDKIEEPSPERFPMVGIGK